MGVMDLDVQRERRVELFREAEKQTRHRTTAVGIGNPRVLESRWLPGDRLDKRISRASKETENAGCPRRSHAAKTATS